MPGGFENRISARSLKIANYQGQSRAADIIVKLAELRTEKDTRKEYGIRYNAK